MNTLIQFTFFFIFLLFIFLFFYIKYISLQKNIQIKIPKDELANVKGGYSICIIFEQELLFLFSFFQRFFFFLFGKYGFYFDCPTFLYVKFDLIFKLNLIFVEMNYLMKKFLIPRESLVEIFNWKSFIRKHI